MTHDEAMQLISARLDGQITAEQSRDLDAYLLHDAEGRVMADAFAIGHDSLSATFEPRRAAAASTAMEVARQLPTVQPAGTSADPSGSDRRNRRRTLIAGVSAAAVLITALVLFNRQSGRIPPDNPNRDITRTDPLMLVGLKPKPKGESPKSAVLEPGKSLVTKAGEKRRVVLPDGTVLFVNQNSAVTLLGDRRLKLDRGTVFLEAVSAKLNPDLGKFTVETPSRTASALGTKFGVSADDRGTGVLVTQGKVEVSGRQEPLSAGQELAADGGLRSTPVTAEAIDWIRDLVAAAETPLVPAGSHGGGALIARDPYGQEAKLQMVRFHVDVHIEDGFARTTIDQTYFNHENRDLEGTFYFPLPPDASLNRLAMYVEGDLMEGGMADRDHARNVYETIRYQNRDPALLEWVDGSLFKMRVFPIEGRREKRLVLSYVQRLPGVNGRTQYRFPAGHSLALVKEWSFHGRVKGGASLSANSASHPAMKFAADGGDLVLTDRVEKTRVDRDIVVELNDHADAGQFGSARWSRAESEGRNYLMLRYRPDLPVAPRPERRDWIILFEASGAHDPLTARAQIEVVRSLLANAEYDDRFMLMTVGTRIRKFSDDLSAVSPAEIERAGAWLDQAHLIGAVHLENALSAAADVAKTSVNPCIVHVGRGIASLGEQRADELLKKIPAGVPYSAVGVGKRVSQSFLKVAAERTGGLFAQINPDEPIAWRGMQFVNTLNAPRLLDAKVVSGSSAQKMNFLTFSNAVAFGEELTAVADVTDGMPTTVTIRGLRDGQPWEKTLTVPNGDIPTAGHLPRSWAKLEIDRLMAESSQNHRTRIIELSKKMYVMTPFTSLLVLENEQMYRQFNVDRGRKDHWAIYPCPPKIPVVYIPDPNLPAGSNPVDLKGAKPHRNQVLQTIVRKRASQAFDSPPQTRVSDLSNLTDVRFYSRGAIPTNEPNDADWDAVTVLGEELQSPKKRPAGNPLNGNERLFYTADFAMDKLESRAAAQHRFLSDPNGRIDEELIGGRRLLEDFSSRSAGFERRKYQSQLELEGLSDAASKYYYLGTSSLMGDQRPEVDALFFDSEKRFGGGTSTARMSFINQKSWTGESLGLSDVRNWDFERSAEIEDSNKTLKNPDRFIRLNELTARLGRSPEYYSRPSFNGNQRVFTDLAGYARGLSSSAADIEAILEVEAAPRIGNRVGAIDPEAAKLLEKSRRFGPRSITIDGSGGSKTVVTYDGQGRYSYETRLTYGLIERVACDGTYLRHYYPELGVGAVRTVSRFHRQFLVNLVHGYLPPPADLARGADLRKIDDRTAAIVPHRTDESGEAPARHLEIHLVFDGDRLAERRMVIMPEGKVVQSEHFAANGTIVYRNSKGKEIGKVDQVWKNADSITDRFDEQNLVMLPLPLRSKQHVYPQLEMVAGWGLDTNQNACFEYLDDVSLMRLIACEFADGNGGYNIRNIWDRTFRKRGDRRPGFYTLMAAAGHIPSTDRLLREDFAADPADPLKRFWMLIGDSAVLEAQAKYGMLPGPQADRSDILSRLLSAKMIETRWRSGSIDHPIWGQRSAERDRAVRFALANAENALGWMILSTVCDRAIRSDAVYRQFSSAWKVLAERSPMKYAARYEQARWLSSTDDLKDTQELFQKLFRDALSTGVLPPLDSNFRSVMERGDQGTWRRLMTETAAVCAGKKARHVVVSLAAQCRQLGDIALADALIEEALRSAEGTEKSLTVVAACRFHLNNGQPDRADTLVRSLLADADAAKIPSIWRLAGEIADGRQDRRRSAECLERALDLEFTEIPQVFDVQPIRNDYGRLMSHYEWIAEASQNLGVRAPGDILVRLVRYADRWRSLDSESTDIVNRTARVIKKIGGPGADELAWEYMTTPLADRPNDSQPLLNLAAELRTAGDRPGAVRCFEMAFAAEPTNPQILWDHSELLKQHGLESESRTILRRIVDGSWQPRFSGLQHQARTAVGIR